MAERKIETELADSVREACDQLNHAIEAALEAGLPVDIDVEHTTEHGATTIDRPIVTSRITRVEEL